ncbi:MAG: UDP-glucose 4-epimerase-like protein [Pirellulaceae bacterium]|nr:MAG: UDP-glucose 4-epimerase-like protein [Pirellulaceae bacterium]
MATFLVTGGAGFIGSHLVCALVRQGHRVRVLDDLSTGKRSNLEEVWDQIDWIEGSICDEPLVAKAVQGVDCVFHQAALASVPLSVERPAASHAVCATGTLVVLDRARRAGVRRVVYASSSAVYGDQPTAAKRESDPMKPISPYGAAKAAGELYCQAFYKTYGLETVCLRYFNVFGPRQDPASPYAAVIPLFLSAMLRGERPTIFGDGRQSRDFVYVENVVEANLLAAECPKAAGKSFNVGAGRATDLLMLVSLLNDVLGTCIEPQFGPARPGDIRESLADICEARLVLGYTPKIDLREGLARTAEWFRTSAAAQCG